MESLIILVCVLLLALMSVYALCSVNEAELFCDAVQYFLWLSEPKDNTAVLK